MSGPYTMLLKGSPAIHSNSMRLAATVLEKVGGSHQVVDLYKTFPMACNACGMCYDGGQCPIEDAFPEIMSLMAMSDLILVATPLHFLAPTAPLVALFSRFQAAWLARQKGIELLPARTRYVAMAVTGGGEYRDMFRPVQAITTAAFAALGIPMVGMATAIDTDTLPVAENAFALKEAQQLGERIRGVFQVTGHYPRQA